MSLDGGVVYDGELTIWDLGSRTTTGFFTSNEAVANNWVIQVTVSGLSGGGKQAVFDFDGSLDGVNWGHITVTTKHAGNLTINSNTTVMYFAQNSPCRFVRAHVTSMPSGPTVACKVGAM